VNLNLRLDALMAQMNGKCEFKAGKAKYSGAATTTGTTAAGVTTAPAVAGASTSVVAATNSASLPAGPQAEAGAPNTVVFGKRTRDSSGGPIALDGTPLSNPVSWYFSECLKHPQNLTLCSTKERTRAMTDVLALEEAARLGFTINIPPPKKNQVKDYVIPAEDNSPSPIVVQLTTLKEKAAEAAKAASAAAAAQAAADQAAKDQAAKAAAEAAAAGKSQAEIQAAADAAAAAAKAKAEQDAAAAAAAAQAAKPRIKASTVAGINGQILVDGVTGKTLYFFHDAPSDTTQCDQPSGCLAVWPILKGDYVADTGVNCKISSVVRADTQQTQITCGGRALYFNKDDTGPGTAKGQNVFGFIAAPNAA